MKNFILSIAFLVSCFASAQLTFKPLGTTTSTNGYIEYLPASYNANSTTKLPVILFFHGSGENGTGSESDMYKIYNTGLPQLIKNNTWTYKDQFVVLMPQHFSDKPFNLCPSAGEVRNFIDFARANYNIDPSQVYITGLSCGANGLYDYIGAYPTNEKVAAAAVISGNGSKASRVAGCNITIPLWSFHGDKDPTSPYTNDVIADNVYKACPAPHAEATLTIYPGGLHDVWTRTYDLSAGNDIYAWMLKYKSPTLGLATNKTETLSVYPNPVKNGILNISRDFFKDSPLTKVSLTDISGKQITLPKQDSLSNQPVMQINVSHLTPGLYILSLEAGSKKAQEKIIIQ